MGNVSAENYVGFTAGAFDLLHAGHVLLLEECNDACDYLIVGLHIDPSAERATKNKPFQSVLERYIQLKAYADEIIPYETERDLETLLRILPINVRITGEEYRNLPFTGLGICKERGIHIHFAPRKHHFSSSELRNRLGV